MSRKEIFSLDEVRGGLGGRRAQKLLLSIETRTAYVVSQSRQALCRILTGEAPEESEYDYFKALALRAKIKPTIRDLERHADEWAALVPDDPKLRATLARLLARRSRFSRADVPNLREALGLDTEAVAAAFEEAFREPLATLYAETTLVEGDTSAEGVPEWLGKDALADLETELEWLSLPGGESLFRSGDAADRMYVVVNGRLRVSEPIGRTGERVYSEIGRGGLVGERAVLTDAPRASDVHAIRDTELVSLTRAGFDELVAKHPRALIHLMRQLVARLATTHKHGRSVQSTIAVVASGRDVPLSAFAGRLAEALGTHGRTFHLTSAALDAQVGEGSSGVGRDDARNGEIAMWLNELETSNRFVVYEAHFEPTEWTARCLRQADHIIVVAASGDSPEVGPVERLVFDPERQQNAPSRELILLHPETKPIYPGTARWLEPRAMINHHHVCLADGEDVARLARFVAGKAVGIALGGGGARGFAHIGALRAIEEAGVPIDYIGGTSCGAIVGATFALGVGVDATNAMVGQVARRGRSNVDLTIPFTSIVAGRKITRTFKDTFGETRIEDLRLKFFAVSSNLSRASMMLHTSGELWRAVRASISLPAVLPPVLEGGDLLVDGALFNNLPADVMGDMVGGGPVIACNVSPAEELRDEYSYDDSLTARKYLVSRLWPFAKRLRTPSLLSVVTRAILLGSSSMEAQQLEQADLVIECALSKYDLFDLERFDEIVDEGYRTAVANLASWPGRPARPE